MVTFLPGVCVQLRPDGSVCVNGGGALDVVYPPGSPESRDYLSAWNQRLIDVEFPSKSVEKRMRVMVK